MGSENKMQFMPLSDDILQSVSGGGGIQYERGDHGNEGCFINAKLAGYRSGELPRYSVGEMVKIVWHVCNTMDVLCNAQVMGISDSKDGGILFRQYTYSVKILSCPNSSMIGLMQNNVHENCLYT